MCYDPSTRSRKVRLESSRNGRGEGRMVQELEKEHRKETTDEVVSEFDSFISCPLSSQATALYAGFLNTRYTGLAQITNQPSVVYTNTTHLF